MRAIVLPNHLAPVATVAIEYGVGSVDDTMPGIAHATEHMMYRGTSDISAGQLAEIGNRMGAEYDASTTPEFTYYYFTVPSPYVGVALRLEADRMTQASMCESDWATERPAIEQEIRAQESMPGYAIGRKLTQFFYGDSAFARPTGGTVASFEKMTAEDIARFYRAWYHPNNATLIISGDVDPDRVLSQVHALFDAISPAQLPAHPALSLAPMASATLTDSIEFPISLSALMYRGPGTTDPGYGASLVLSQALNSSPGAIADLTAGEKLLGALSISSALPEVGSMFLVGVPAIGGSPQVALDLLSGVLAEYRDRGVPKELVEAAKLRLLSQQAYEQASISGLAFRWATAVGNRESPDTAFNAIARVTDDDVNRLLRTYYTPAHRIAAILTSSGFLAPPKIDTNGSVEHVRYVPSASEPLPDWASTQLDVPLKLPQAPSGRTVVHLSNGITVAIDPEAVASAVILKGEIETSPQLYEPKGREGVAELTKLLLPWGTTTYDRKAFQAQLDEIGANISLGNNFSLTVTPQNLDRAVEILADGLIHPAFPTAGFEVVRNQLVAATEASQRLPATEAADAATDALYPPGDPRRRRITVASLQAITLADVRRWYAFAYRPDLTTIVLVGDVAPSEAHAVVARYFGGWKAFGAKPDFAFPPLPQVTSKSETITVKAASAVQSRVMLEQIVPRRDAGRDYVPLLLANTILSGEGVGSLLFRELRTRDGYVYSVSSDFDVDRDGATFRISYASDAKNVDSAQAAAMAIVERLRTIPLSETDLEQAKSLLLAQRVLPLRSYAGIAAELLAEQQSVATQRNASFWASLVSTTPVQLRDAMHLCVRPDKFMRIVLAPAR